MGPPAARRTEWQIVNERSGAVIATHVTVAVGRLARSLGLLALPRLRAGEALWLAPCNGVHTVGMRYAIGVLALDAGGRVIAIRERVMPLRIVAPVHSGHTTVEMLPETVAASGVQIGDPLALRRVEP